MARSALGVLVLFAYTGDTENAERYAFNKALKADGAARNA